MIEREHPDADQPGEQAAPLGAQRERRSARRAGAGAAGRCRGRRAGPGRCRAGARSAPRRAGGRAWPARAGAAPRAARRRTAAAPRPSPAASPTAASRPTRCPRPSAASSATASAAPAIPVAMRRVGAIWLATAPTPTKTGSGETSAIERKTEGPTPARPTRIPASSASHTIAAPDRDPGQRRPEHRRRGSPRPERTSSRRPASSSARSARTAASMPHSAGEDREGAQPPRHVAADGEQVVGHAVEQAHARGSRRSCARAAGGPGASGRRCGRPRPARAEPRRKSSANEIVRVRASRRVWRASALAADTAVRAVVVVQEDLLEGRLAAVERDARGARPGRR